MKNKRNLISIIIILPILIVLAACGTQKTKWKGTIEEENGVTIVNNPKEPMYGEDVFSLEEELTIGEAEGREEYMFSQIRSIAVDKAGRVYVLDSREAQVKVFDQNGTYVRSIGKRGQGPGEFTRPLSISITGQNEIVVDDFTSRLVLFSLEGEFKRNINIAKIGLLRVETDSEMNMVGIAIVREEENPRYELKKFDSELNYLHSFGSSPLPTASGGSINLFMGFILSQIDNNDQVICGYPENYEIKIFDKEGKLRKKIIKEYDPLEITKEEIEGLAKKSWDLFMLNLGVDDLKDFKGAFVFNGASEQEAKDIIKKKFESLLPLAVEKIKRSLKEGKVIYPTTGEVIEVLTTNGGEADVKKP